MSKASDLEIERRKLYRLSTKTMSIIHRLGTFITTLLAAKILWEFVAGFSLTPKGAWGFVQITVLIYFWSWFLAGKKGVEIQSQLLNTTASSDQIPFAGYFALSIGFPIGAATMALVLFSDLLEKLISNYWSGSLTELLVAILAVFWVWDMLWQWSVRKTMLRRIAKTKKNFEGPTKRYIELEQLSYLENFLFGYWRILRKIIGVGVIVSLLFVVFFMKDPIVIPIIEITTSINSFVAITTFLFVIFSEGWIWIMRHRMIVGIASLERIGQEYNLNKKAKQNSIEKL